MKVLYSLYWSYSRLSWVFLPYPPNFLFFFFSLFKTFVLPKSSWLCGFPGKHCQLVRGSSPKWNFLSLSQQLTIATPSSVSGKTLFPNSPLPSDILSGFIFLGLLHIVTTIMSLYVQLLCCAQNSLRFGSFVVIIDVWLVGFFLLLLMFGWLVFVADAAIVCLVVLLLLLLLLLLFGCFCCCCYYCLIGSFCCCFCYCFFWLFLFLFSFLPSFLFFLVIYCL